MGGIAAARTLALHQPFQPSIGIGLNSLMLSLPGR